MKSHQLYVVAEWAGVIHSVPLTPHHLQEVVEGGLGRGGRVWGTIN